MSTRITGKVGLILSLLLVFVLAISACTTEAETTPTEAMIETEAPIVTEEMTEEPVMTEEMSEEPAMTEEMTEEPAMTEEPTGDEQIGGTVNVLAVWGGEELANFEAMIAPFEERTGIDVQYEGTRDLNAILTTRIQGGNPPDLAGLPGPGQLIEFARDGYLVPLNDVLDMSMMQDQYDEGFLNLATVDGQLYGIFIKAAVKSLVWYNTSAFEAAGYTVPTTWEELNSLEDQMIADGVTPWCIGLESGAASGWPGTDWIEDIMLRTAGPDTYDQWYTHEIPWTDPAVQNAWETWGTIVNDPEMVYGGAQNVLATNFGESPFPLFQDPPQCYMHRQASFITGFIGDQFPDLAPGEDYNFFVFPPIDEAQGEPLLVAGDLFGMFNDTPQARALMEYLVTAEAQSIWAERGGFLSANRTVDPNVYPDQLTQQIGEMLTEASAVRFDASDLMPEAVNNAFWSGILEFISNPDDLPTILENIETVAQDAYTQ
ncbi:MAG TPA: ABC transporter substrate-binding protein [Anaerolineales bacterium]|nr:ABC transporter substrate-binding protein [Anaerolineales bacterium]